MKNLFLKKKLTIKGAGGGGGKGQTPPPPNVAQYPAVLAPPQFSNLNTINSFSYAEIVDLISDGPIEGLINKNGKKVYDENIFEGIFLNNTPIKETSSEKKQSIPIYFLKEKLKTHWSHVDNVINNKLIASSPRTTVINKSSIDDVNFTSDISITSYHPTDSIFQFIKSLNGSFDAVSLISKAFDLSPIINERPFLTKISIPKFTINLSKEKFDITEGGVNSPSPLKAGIVDLSNYIYFSIGSETLNSFNYFELPRSFVNNNSSTSGGKKTFKKNLISSTDYYKYEIYDFNIYIWSIYNEEVGIKNIDDILDRYFKYIYIFQNDFSLFNYNLVQSEFKNGSEIQAPLKYFTNVEIDTEYGKELIGPFKICNCFNPSGALENGGIQRVITFSATNSYTPPATTVLIENETSDDIRYVQSWPIEYDCKGAPYLICNARLNYTQFDKTSSSRTAQDAIPITHYIENENVEEVFVSLNVQQLYDTNHIDLVSDNSAILGLQGKKNQTSQVGPGVNTYGDIVGFNNSIGFTVGNIYLLIYGSSATNGYVLDGLKTTETSIDNNLLVCNLRRVTDKNNAQTLYYNTISVNGLASKIPLISNLIGGDSTKATWNADTNNNLINYQIPNDAYSIKESFNINGYSISSLESKLKLLNEDQSPLYCFGLADNEKITSTSINQYIIPVESYITNTTTRITTYLSSSTKAPDYNFYIATVQYRTASVKELAEKATVAHIINHYIDWDALLDKTVALSEINYPNIFKYILNPYFVLNKIKGNLESNYSYSIIGNLYLIGINGSYLRSQTSFFSSTNKLKLSILDQLLEEFLLVTDQSSNFKNIDSNNGSTYISDYSTTKALENSLLKFQNGKLIGSSSVYNLKKYTVGTVPYLSTALDKNKTNSTRDIYNLNNIFLYRTQYVSINAEDALYDIIFYYNLYSNVAKNSTLTVDNSGVKYINKSSNTDAAGNQEDESFPAGADPSKAQQSITAGTKLPAIVVVDVETGYESKEKELYRGCCEYFSYRYNIFGMSTENSIIDLGRKSYDFVNACKMSLDRGGYVSKYRNIYNKNLPLYLFELICCSSTASITGYYLINKKEVFLGEMDLSKIEFNSNYNISYISGSNSNVGSQQQFQPTIDVTISDITTTISNENNIASNYSFLTKTLSSNLLSSEQVSRFFNNNFTNLDLNASLSYLKSDAVKFLSLNLSPADSYVASKSISANNECYFDTYKYIDTENSKCLHLKIYNYYYTAYENIFVNPLWNKKVVGGVSYVDYISAGSNANITQINSSTTFVIYVDLASRRNSPSSLALALINYYKSALILSFDGFIIRFGKSEDPKIALKASFPTLDNWSTTKTDNSISIEKPLPTNVAADLINNLDYINVELYNKSIINPLTFVTETDIRNSLNLLKLKSLTTITLKIATGVPGFLAQSLLNENKNNYFYIQYTSEVPLLATDKRISLFSNIYKDPLYVAASFWTILDKKNNKLSIIFSPTTRENSYKELEKVIEYVPFESFSSYRNFTITKQSIFPSASGPFQTSNSLPPNETRNPYFWYSGLPIKQSYNYDLKYQTTPIQFTYTSLETITDKVCLNISSQGFSSYVNRSEIKSLLTWKTFDERWLFYYCETYQYTPNSRPSPINFFWLGSSIGSNAVEFSINSLTEKVKYYTSIARFPYYYTYGKDQYNVNWNNAILNTETNMNPRMFIKNININNQNSYTLTLDDAVTFCAASLITIDSKNYCIITKSINSNDNVLASVEYTLVENGIVPMDFRMFTYESPACISTNWNNSNYLISYYKNIPISNVFYDTKNTYANDSGLRIQIPAPKNDQYGNPMRRYVKVTRRSHETLSPLIGKKIGLNKVTEIIPQRFSYPFSSIVGTKIDSRAFSQIPTRTFHCKLKKILVPSNYFPNNEDEEDVRYLEGEGKHKIYEGDWDGTFKLAWSNNPAWVLMDLLINKRYGLGNYIESDQVDIWELYKISRWCDCVDDSGYYHGVSDGFGGVEPRHSFNALISDKFNIFDMINQVASVFRGHVYYMNSLITFDDDRIKPIIGEFNNSDVKDGLFNYTNHKKDDEFTVVDIAYIDARDNYKPKIEYVEDSDGIRQRGILKKHMNAFGVTSKAQARRFGKYFLYQTSKENTNVAFITDNKALLYKPGDLIRINDELINSIKNFGQVKKIVNNNSSCFTVTIDKKLDPTVYSDTEISLYVPVAKPKYDDYYANAQFIPENLIFCTSSPVLGSIKTKNYGTIVGNDNITYNGLYCKSIEDPYIEFKMKSFDSSSPIKSFSGVADVRYKIETLDPPSTFIKTKSETGYLIYIENSNINQQPSRYGYWQFTTGISENEDKLIFDILENENLKYQLPYKNYFFEFFDTGRYLRYSGIDEFDNKNYNSIDFDPREIYLWPNLPDDNSHTGIVSKRSVSKFSISSYKDPVITYQNVIENDRPSIDTFYILNYSGNNYTHNDEIYNEYTELILSKSGKSNNGNFDKIKSSTSEDLCKLSVGSTYSLNLLNNKDKIYKIMTISENYINEYNIIASEYNLDKFKEIEDNSEIDNLQNTFNFLTAQSQASQISEKDKLAAPIISSLRYISNLRAIEIKWNLVQNAASYDIYIQTPSRQTNNFTAKASYEDDYNNNISSFLKIWYLPENSEIGTYTISIQSVASDNVSSSYKFSAISKRSINILNY